MTDLSPAARRRIQDLLEANNEYLERARAAERRLFEAQIAKHPPILELETAQPLVLYFASEQDRDNFIAAINDAFPNLIDAVIPGRASPRVPR